VKISSQGPVRKLIKTLDFVLLKDKSLVFATGLGKSILEPVSGYYKDLATMPNAIIHPTFYLSSYILPRDLQGRLRFHKLWNRTVSCKLVDNLIF